MLRELSINQLQDASAHVWGNAVDGGWVMSNHTFVPIRPAGGIPAGPILRSQLALGAGLFPRKGLQACSAFRNRIFEIDLGHLTSGKVESQRQEEFSLPTVTLFLGTRKGSLDTKNRAFSGHQCSQHLVEKSRK